MTQSGGTPPSGTPPEDGLDLVLRLVRYLFGRAFKEEATATWSAPGPVVLLGAAPGGPALAVVTRWGAKVAGRLRADGRLQVCAVHDSDDDMVVNLATQEAEAAPPWSAGIPELAYSLLSPEFGGASLLAFMDVPDESGILAGAALHTALALALADLSGSQESELHRRAELKVDPAALLAALGGQGEIAAAYAASLLGRHGYAILLTPGRGAARHVAFDPTAAGLRLVLMSARPDAGAPPRQRWAADPSDDARAGAAAAAIAAQDWPRLGTLLTAAHRAGLGLRDPVDADLLVDSALATGALGGRATSSTTAFALVPVRSLRDLRAAARHAFAERGRSAPRFLTTGALPPPAEGSDSLLAG
jgi:galactokinase